MRTPDVWFAVRRSRGTRSLAGDLRYDAGLVALKVRRGRSGWRDVLRQRPLTRGRPDSVGPNLLGGRSVGLPFGTSIDVDRLGIVTVRGGWRSARGRLLREGVVFVYEPTRCGVRVRVPLRPGDVLEHSTFVTRSPRKADASGDIVTDPGLRVSSRPRPERVRSRGGYASGLDARLTRVRTRHRSARYGELRLTFCGR